MSIVIAKYGLSILVIYVQNIYPIQQCSPLRRLWQQQWQGGGQGFMCTGGLLAQMQLHVRMVVWPGFKQAMALRQAAHWGLGTCAVQDYSHFFLFYVWVKSYVCCKEKSLKKIDLKVGKLMKNLMTGNKCVLWYQWEMSNILPSRSHVISLEQTLLPR